MEITALRRALWLAVLILPPALSRSEVDRPPPSRPPPPAPSTPSPSPPAPAVSCVGRWQGVGRQEGPAWTIDLNVANASPRCGTIEYPSLGCGGYLTQCQFAGGHMTAVEVYTHNPGTCAPAGTFRGDCDAGSMRWVWTGDDVVRSVLRRI